MKPTFRVQKFNSQSNQMAAVIVHGGAYAIPDRIADSKVKGCQKAAEAAHKALIAGRSALDAVEIAVRHLEDNPLMNAGHGSILNAAGEVEMDAIIMDGGSLNFGAVAGVRNISNPISLARMVMEKTNHVMLIGLGANLFAREMGVPEIDPFELVTQESKDKYEQYTQYSTVVHDVFNYKENKQPSDCTGSLGDSSSLPGESDQSEHDTVGAVAIDLKGNIAAATSTGGISLKRVGRVGDAPLVGSGAYCDNTSGGVSCTGHGEAIAKVLLAQHALTLLQSKTDDGSSADSVLAQSLEYMLKRVGGRGGMIMVTKDGEVAKSYTTKRMAWASVNKRGELESGL